MIMLNFWKLLKWDNGTLYKVDAIPFAQPQHGRLHTKHALTNYKRKQVTDFPPKSTKSDALKRQDFANICILLSYKKKI